MHARPERHLLIGDARDLPLLRVLLASLPRHATGEVFVELPDARRPILPAPAGISTRYLRRRPGELPGTRACAAFESWVGEWVHGEHESPEAHAVFLGLAGNPLVARACDRMGAKLPHLHLHRPCCPGMPQAAGMPQETGMPQRAGLPQRAATPRDTEQPGGDAAAQ